MGSGKSSAGKALAKESEQYFLDTDAMIESAEGKSIERIFKDDGEAYFRRCEEETVQWLRSSVKNAIISTGGGMLVHCKGLKEVGKIVYLRVPFKTILERMDASELEKRPLFKDLKTAEQMHEKRDCVYEEKADLIIDAQGTLEETVAKLRAYIT